MPTAGPGEVLVRIRAASVTRGDVVLRKMPKLITRLVGETPKSILGHEFAGQRLADEPPAGTSFVSSGGAAPMRGAGRTHLSRRPRRQSGGRCRSRRPTRVKE